MFKFDTHMHFDLYDDRKRILDYLEKAKSYTIAVTNLPELYERYRGMDKNYKYVNISLGFHPELLEQYEKQITVFEKYISEARYVGEIGLDYSDSNCNREKQKELFKYLILLANRSNDKILTVHSRRAESDVLDVTKDFSGTVILHWYSGSIKNLERAISEDKYFSINQQMVKSKNGRKIIEKIPIERLLIESDAPFTKGLENEYTVDFMNDIYEEISSIKRISTEELYSVFKNNFKTILLRNR